MIFRNMSPSETPGNFPVALTQFFTGNTGLRHGINISAFPSPLHSDSGEECISRLDYGSLTLRPAALLALLSEQTRLASSPRGRLHPGFQRLGHPRRRRISLQCQLGNLHWRDSHPLDHQLASLHYPGGTSLQRWDRALLRHAMESEGFTVYGFEWWHFDYKDWRKYPILNLRFDQIRGTRD
jgi:D-ala-D-ala dipeptidase